MKNNEKSLKTTISGWSVLLGLVLSGIGFFLDDNPETNPDYASIVSGLQAMGLLGAGIGGGLLGIFAKDKDKK